ncbi:MAG: hypothetical protein WC250_02080 [Candidatus Paceibacterota bacterium]|jgi:hypothetical protein
MKTPSDFVLAGSGKEVKFRGFSVGVLAKPKLAFSRAPKDFSEALLEKLYRTGISSFGRPESRGFYDDVKEHTQDGDMLALAYSDTDVLGFASANLHSEHDLFYLFGVLIGKQHKTRGVGIATVKTLFAESGLRKIGFTTQNPVMFCFLRKLCKRVSANPASPIVPAEWRKSAKVLMSDRNGSFNEQTFVSHDLYSQCLYDEIPKSDDEEVNRWFQTSLRIRDGKTRDGFLFLGEAC